MQSLTSPMCQPALLPVAGIDTMIAAAAAGRAPHQLPPNAPNGYLTKPSAQWKTVTERPTNPIMHTNSQIDHRPLPQQATNEHIPAGKAFRSKTACAVWVHPIARILHLPYPHGRDGRNRENRCRKLLQYCLHGFLYLEGTKYVVNRQLWMLQGVHKDPIVRLEAMPQLHLGLGYTIFESV